MFIFKRSTAGVASALITIALIALLSGCTAPQPRTGSHGLQCAAYETRFCRSWGTTLDCSCVDPRNVQIHG
jgi:hypothetical protein